MEELLSLRNFFYTGNHAKVIAEAKNLGSLSGKLAVNRDVFVFRSLTAQKKYQEVFKAIDQRAATPLQAVKLLATFQAAAADSSEREMVFDTLREWLADATLAVDPVVRLIAAQIYFENGDYKQTLKLANGIDDLEMKALCILVYVQIDRTDLAQSTLKQMTEMDDDDTLTALASSWVDVSQGGDRVKEAFDVLQELAEKFGNSVELNNGMAVCLMHQRNFANAFTYLKAARDMALQGGEKVSATTLVNSIVCLQQLKKPQAIIDKIVAELRGVSPSHPWLQKQTELDSMLNNAMSGDASAVAFV